MIGGDAPGDAADDATALDHKHDDPSSGEAEFEVGGQIGDEVGVQAQLGNTEKQGTQGQTADGGVAHHRLKGADKSGQAQASFRIAAVIKDFQQGLASEGAEQAEAHDGQYGDTPGPENDNKGDQQSRHRSAERHAGLFDGKIHATYMRGRGACQYL